MHACAAIAQDSLLSTRSLVTVMQAAMLQTIQTITTGNHIIYVEQDSWQW
jgi:hypothetical protein